MPQKEKNMNAYNQIISKQIEWAKNKGLQLVGSGGHRGRKVYTASIEDNLFQPLNEKTRENLENGDVFKGSEFESISYYRDHIMDCFINTGFKCIDDYTSDLICLYYFTKEIKQ